MRPNFLFLLITLFAVMTATAQLYDNRSRYLQGSFDKEHSEWHEHEIHKPVKNNNYYSPSQNSYSNYRKRVNNYASPKLDSREFYDRYREPSVFSRYNTGLSTNGGSLENELNINDCHCNFKVDINYAFHRWYEAQQMARAALLRGYEKLFEKKIENLLNKQFPDFKSAQKEFFKEYVKIGDDRHRSNFAPIIKKDYFDQFNLLEKNTAFYNVANDKAPYSFSEILSLVKLRDEVYKSEKEFLVSKELNHLKNGYELPYHGYMVNQFIKHYNDQDNYEYKLGSFNGYIEHFQNQVGYGTVLKPNHNYGPYMHYLYDYDVNEVINYMKNIIRKNITSYDYKLNYSLEYSKAIVAFYNMKFPQTSTTIYVSAGRWGRIPVKVPVPGAPLKCQENRSIHNNPELEGIKQAILNKTPLKKAVFRYLANAKSHRDGQKTVLEAVGCRLKDSPFEWSELSHLPHIKFQESENPEIIMSIKLKKRVAPNYLFDDGIEGEMVMINNILWKEYNMHQGIADVLKYIYNVEKYWGVEGATIRHFLKEKGLNVPSSLSDHDLGTLFDFGGGNTDYLTIEFSDYAKKYILNFQHYDGKYGWSLFTDPFKLQALEEILKEKKVDFKNKLINNLTGKARCVFEKLTIDNSELFRETIGSFIDNPKFNLTFIEGECSNTDQACTDDDYVSTTGNITIKIENVNTNPLDIATLILHESIHAEIARFVVQYKTNVNVNDRPRLLQLFQYYKNLYDNQSGEIDHIYMTEKYITPIAKALRQFDNNSYPLDYYRSFAWDGLRKWDANKILTEPLNDKYEDYRHLVIKNSKICIE